MSMKKPAALMAGVGTCALAVASCSSPAPAPQSDPVVDSSPSAVQSGQGYERHEVIQKVS